MKPAIINRVLNFIRKPFFSYAIFWSWNAVFLVLLVGIEIEVSFMVGLMKNVWKGFLPLDYGLYSLLIFAIPLASILIGATILRKRPYDLLKLFYGVEVPLTLIFILRLAVFREMTAGTLHLFLLLGFGMVSYLIEILVKPERIPNGVAYLMRIGHTMLLITGLYIGFVLIFYSVPMGWFAVREFFRFEWVRPFKESFLPYVAALLFSLTWTLIVFLPAALPILYFRAFARKSREELRYGKVLMLSTLVVNIGLLFLLNSNQPQIKTFAFFESDFTQKENRIELIQREKSLKKGLMNAYLNKDRYLGTPERNNHIKELYKESFGLENEAGQALQNLDNFVLSPFLYDGDWRTDDKKAAELYQKYFDQNIQKGEQERILHAVRSHWGADDIEAGLLNVNEEKVHIQLQEIAVNEHLDAAEIQIHEVYQNKTFDRQEIFYYFSLPENSVFTGLWLSDDPAVEKKYAFQVSPRGAAQEVYKREVRRRVDPSLLEQVGPNQYRLRAFPIEPKRKDYGEHWRSSNFTVIEGPEMHLWLSYKTLISPAGTWDLPQLNERRNVYWSDQTTLLINGERVEKTDEWLPAQIKAESSAQPAKHLVQLNDSVKIEFGPAPKENLPAAGTMKMAVLLDGSFSMRQQKAEVQAILDELKTSPFKSENIRAFVIGETCAEYSLAELETALKSQEDLFFGSSNYTEMIHTYTQKGPDQKFDLILMISDQGNYESETDTQEIVNLASPLFLLHTGEKRAPIYSDAFLEIMQNSKGTVVSSLDDLEEQIWAAQKRETGLLARKNGISYAQSDEFVENADPFYLPLAAKYFIESREINPENRLAEMDAIHQIALSSGIISPYSSMIVLVNDEQKQRLKEAEEREDRFDREIESGMELTDDAGEPFNVTGTPEPHEWILIFMVAGFLIYGYWRRKRGISAGY
ncbi:MAG: TIGR02921 family PEP-CTERM protein [Bacteroidia bacterium]|nr:TIGR02921 family PEP-CTERM protein [Bacteroidia bacterium]